MTKEEMQEFKNLFCVYCRHQVINCKCDSDDCEFCPIDKAYKKIVEQEEKDNVIKIHVCNILWDVDDTEDYDYLPDEVYYEVEDGVDVNDDALIEDISEWLSDEYGFCHSGFQVEF